MPAAPDPAELTRIDALAAAQRATAEWRAATCSGCGANGPYSTLHGWHPCRCGGHATKHCQCCDLREYRPELGERCKAPRIGPGPA